MASAIPAVEMRLILYSIDLSLHARQAFFDHDIMLLSPEDSPDLLIAKPE
jgi:hypothetical protein